MSDDQMAPAAMPEEPPDIGFETWRDFTHPSVIRYIDALAARLAESEERLHDRDWIALSDKYGQCWTSRTHSRNKNDV